MSKANPNDEQLDAVLEFLRGDSTPRDFEQRARADAALEGWLGTSLHLETISTDYGDADAVFRLRKTLASFAEREFHDECRCRWLSRLTVLAMGDAEADRILEPFESLAERGGEFWWLEARQCRVCERAWLFGQEERINDLWIMRRLLGDELRAILVEDRWPVDFDSYLTLLRIGRESGRFIKWADPVNDIGTRELLKRTLADIRSEEPSLSLEEAATLLGITLALAQTLAVPSDSEQ